MPRNRNQNNDQDINIIFEWFQGSIGTFLVLEFVLTPICGLCLSSVEILHPGSRCSGNVYFLELVAWAAFVKILIVVIIRILGLRRQLRQIVHHPGVHAGICGLAVVLFLIASLLVATCAKVHFVHNSGAAVAAAVFGFICAIPFAVECYIHFTEFRNMQADPEAIWV